MLCVCGTLRPERSAVGLAAPGAKHACVRRRVQACCAARSACSEGARVRARHAEIAAPRAANPRER
eukprot:6157922-Prymnesium_polylepis.2